MAMTGSGIQDMSAMRGQEVDRGAGIDASLGQYGAIKRVFVRPVLGDEAVDVVGCVLFPKQDALVLAGRGGLRSLQPAEVDSRAVVPIAQIAMREGDAVVDDRHDRRGWTPGGRLLLHRFSR